MLKEISQKDFDVDAFVRLAVQDEQARREMVYQLIHNKDIMVYYHCYYVLSKASQQHPGLFYAYWGEIASLLQHKNSYHRDFAITILANLSAVDKDNRFEAIFDAYFEHLADAKFMTACGCVANAIKIIRSRPGDTQRVLKLLLDLERRCVYPEKQKALLKGYVLEVIEQVYAQCEDRSRMDAFIRAERHSISPKTRKKARELAAQFAL